MAKTSESGVWDQTQDPLGSERSGPTFVKQTPKSKQTKVVRDDWDDDDDEDEDESPEQGRDTRTNPSEDKTKGARLTQERCEDEESSKIWEEANKRAPMPELIVAPTSTSQGVAPPPPAALQPTLRILKRPSPNTSANHVAISVSPSPSSGPSSASGATSPGPRGTLAEREAQYQEARSRIFGEKEKLGSSSPGLISRASSSSGGVVVVRDPLGPASEQSLESGGQDKVHGVDRPAKGFGERRRGKK